MGKLWGLYKIFKNMQIADFPARNPASRPGIRAHPAFAAQTPDRAIRGSAVPAPAPPLRAVAPTAPSYPLRGTDFIKLFFGFFNRYTPYIPDIAPKLHSAFPARKRIAHK
jgi:hypothetical protein